MLFSTYLRSLLQSGNRRSAMSGRRRSAQADARFAVEALEARAMLTAGIGLQAQYFATGESVAPALVRLDSEIDFNWGAASADANLLTDDFSVRWSGQVEATRTESHTFTVTSNDTARLWVNGQLLIDGPVSEVSDGSIDLIAGRRYDIELEYVEQSDDASIRLEWQSHSLPQQVIPAQQLFPAARGSISVERSSDAGESSTATFSSFVSTISDNQTSERISGWLHATETGPYRLFIAADGQAELWLSNSHNTEGTRKIAEVKTSTAPQDFTARPEQQANTVYLVAGQSYFIEAIHRNPLGIEHLSVGWIPPGATSISEIPGMHLSPVLPTVRMYANNATTAEGSSAPATFTVVRSGAVNDSVSIDYTIRGTAINGVDYVQLPGSITIQAGEASATLQLTPLVDSLIEAEETATIELLAGTDYQVGLISERTVYATIHDDTVAPNGATAVWSASGLNEFSHFGGTFTSVLDTTWGEVLQAEIDVQPEDAYSAQLTSLVENHVAAGDILLLEFYARAIGEDAEFSVVFEQNGGEYTKSLIQGVSVGNQWSKVQIPFASAENYAPNDATFGFHLGQQIQTVQFASMRILSYGQPQSMITGTDLAVYQEGGAWGTGQSVAVNDQSFAIAYQIETAVVPPEAWQLQAYQRNARGIASGETMQIEFAARATSAVAQAEFMVQRTDMFQQLTSDLIDLSSDWQTFHFEFAVEKDFGAGDLQIAFHLGFGLQKIQFGDVTWKNVNHQLDLIDLPSQLPAANYGGRSGLDTWRPAADDRIDSERKAAVTINVRDANGDAVNGAVVSVSQNSHAFQFGSSISALDGNLAVDGTDQALKYQSEIARLFNTVVIENSLKWPRFADARQLGIDGAEFAVENGLNLRGHNIVWPSRENMPDSVWHEYDFRVVQYGDTAAAAWLRKEIESHVSDMVRAFAGAVDDWDVVNEPFDNHDVMDTLGDEIIVAWYRQVREVNLEAVLTLNDYDIFASNGSNSEHRNNFDGWLTTLIAADLLDQIGEQGHYNDGNLTDITVLADLISDYNISFDRPIAITEFDVDSTDEQLQADYLRDYLTMSFSQPGVSKFVQWGFWEAAHYLPQAALYREDFSIKPNGQVYEDLVFGRWWTDVRGTTHDGEFTTDAFQGNYDVQVVYSGQIHHGNVTVGEAATSELTIHLPVVAVEVESPALQSASMVPVTAMPLLSQTPPVAATPSAAELTISSVEHAAEGIVSDIEAVWGDAHVELLSLFPIDDVQHDIEMVAEIADDLDVIDEVLETVGDWLKIF